MKTQKRHYRATVFLSLSLFGIIMFWGFQVFCQELTAEQKEVWEVVKADIELFKKGDLEGLSASRHEDVIIWWGSKAKPFDKKTAFYNYRSWFDYDKPVKWELEPLAIKISGGRVASVFYTYRFSGKFTSGSGRDMDTWIKQDNKWMMINSFGASCDKLPPCK